MELVLFDFDGTLTRRDSLMPFLRQVAGDTGFALGLARMSPVLGAYALRLMRNDRAKERVLGHFLRGRPLDELQAQGRRFASERLPALLRADTMARLSEHVRAGHTCVLVSASLDLYLEPWSREQGFAGLLCSRLETSADGRVSGRLLGGNCFGPEKARRIEAWLQGRRPASVTAYGDSRGDREMLALADRPVWV